MIIRPAKETDADMIAQLWLDFVEYHHQLDDNTPQVAQGGDHRYAMQIRWSIADNYIQTYVAEDSGQIVGYVYGMVMSLTAETFVEERAGMIGDIYVIPESRGQGIGNALVQAIKDWFKLRGVTYFEWYVAVANERGVHFWRDVMGGRPFMLRMRGTLEDD